MLFQSALWQDSQTSVLHNTAEEAHSWKCTDESTWSVFSFMLLFKVIEGPLAQMLSGDVEVPVADVQLSRERFDVTPLNDRVKIIQRVEKKAARCTGSCIIQGRGRSRIFSCSIGNDLSCAGCDIPYSIIPLAKARLSLLISVSWAKMLSPRFSFEDLHLLCAADSPQRDQDKKDDFFFSALLCTTSPPTTPTPPHLDLLCPVDIPSCSAHADTCTNTHKS